MNEELFFNKKIDEKDLGEINSKAPITINLQNTLGQDPNIIRKLDNKVTIRVTHSLGEGDYSRKNLYSPQDIASIIDFFEDVEKRIDPEWPDLQKATFEYILLLRNLEELEPSKSDNEKEISEGLLALFTQRASSKGFADIYKEAMDRLGIPCRYIENPESTYAWNEIQIDGKYYPLDLLLDVRDNRELIQEGAFELKHFLSDEGFYKDERHFTKEEHEENAIDHARIQDAIDNIFKNEINYIEEKKEPRPTINIKSKELSGIFEGGEISEDSELARNKRN